MNKNTGSKNLSQNKMGEAARAAGFGSERECEITPKTLQRWVKEGKVVTMTIGTRTFYHLETTKKLASELRDPAEGMVLVSSLIESPSAQRMLIAEIRSGAIRGQKFSVDGKKGAWHADEASAKNWLARRGTPAIRKVAEPTAVPTPFAQVAQTTSVATEDEVIDVVRSMLRAHNKRATDAHTQMTALVERAEVVVERLVLALDRACGTAPVGARPTTDRTSTDYPV